MTANYLPEIGSTIYLKKGVPVYKYTHSNMTPLGPLGRKATIIVSGLAKDKLGRDLILYSKNSRALYA